MTEDLIFVDEKAQEANQSNPQIQINAKGISADFMERYRQEQEKKQKAEQEQAKRKMEKDSSIFQAKLKAEKEKSLNLEKEKAAKAQRQLEKEEYWKRLEDIRKRGIKGPAAKSPEIKITGSGKSQSKDSKSDLKKNNQSNIPPKLPPTPKKNSENDEKLAQQAANKKSETIYKCSNCQKLFNTLTSIRQHDCAVQAQAAKKQSQQAEKSKQETEKNIKNPSKSASDEVTIYKCSLCEKPFLTLPEVKNHTCSQTKPPQNKNGNQSGAAKKDVTIYKCSLCQKPFLTIQEARNHDCPAQQKTGKKPEQKPKATQIQSPKPSQSPKPTTLQTTPPVSNKPTFNKWAENHGKNSSNVVAAKKPDPPTDDICFVDCGFDDADTNEKPKEPKLVEKSQTESQDQVADQSMVFVDVAEPFHDNDTSAAAENTQENQDNPEEPSFDQTDINAALSNEFLFDFVDCSDEFIGFEENETTESQESQKQVEKTVETNHKEIDQHVPSAIKNTQQSKVTVNPYKKLYLTGDVNNPPNPSKKINQTAVEADKRRETNEKPKEPKVVEKSQIDHDDVVFDNQREVDNQILYPVDDEDESGGSIKIGQKMSEKANNQKEVSKLVQKMPEKANSTKETEDDITFKPPKKQIGDTIFTTKNGKISEKEKTTQTNSLTTQKGSGNKSPFSHRYDQVENELEAMFAGIDQKTPEKATIQKKPVVSVAKEGNDDSYLPEREFVHDMDFNDSGIY